MNRRCESLAKKDAGDTRHFLLCVDSCAWAMGKVTWSSRGIPEGAERTDLYHHNSTPDKKIEYLNNRKRDWGRFEQK